MTLIGIQNTCNNLHHFRPSKSEKSGAHFTFTAHLNLEVFQFSTGTHGYFLPYWLKSFSPIKNIIIKELPLARAILIGSLLLFSKIFFYKQCLLSNLSITLYPFSAGFHPCKAIFTTVAHITMLLNEMEIFLSRIIITLLHNWCLISL